MKRRIDAAKKSQMFKWHFRRFCYAGKVLDGAVEFRREFCMVNGQRAQIAVPVVYLEYPCPHGACFTFRVNDKTIYLPWNDGIISYANVLDKMLALMKRCSSECRLIDEYGDFLVFFEKGTTLESLAIEFDLSYKDALCRNAAVEKSKTWIQ